jgi:hypothetical protein
MIEDILTVVATEKAIVGVSEAVTAAVPEK